MDKNHKVLKNGLNLILLTLVISIGIAYYLKLDRPVFLKSYIERYLPSTEGEHYLDAQFIIRYITNGDDGSTANYIEFEEYPGIYVNASEYNQSGFRFFNNNENRIPGHKVGRYSVRDIYLTIDARNVDNKNEDIRLTKAKVHFSNGDVEVVDIGEWILYEKGEFHVSEHFEHMMGKGFSDDTYQTQNIQEKVKVDIELIKMESNILDQFQGFIEIKVGNKDYKDISGEKYTAGDYLKIDSVFKTPTDPELSMYDFDLRPQLQYKDSEGKPFIYRFYNVDYRKYNFEFLEIIKFLRVRGEL